MNSLAHLGNFFIIGAAVCSSLSIIFYILVWRGKESYRNLARSFYSFSASFVVVALLTLVYLIFRHDFSVAYVYSYSATDLPWFYLLASLWGGQEGTFLLWIFYASLMGFVLMRTAKSYEKGTMVFLNMFILSVLMIIIKKSPFEISPVFHAEGASLNPLLQNFWMTIHPPIMFLGFATAVFPFCFALTALVDRTYVKWAEAARRWTMFAWAALGTSLVMGGYWAYVTLGWGGFWAWDPVENSSFIPWIFLTAQVHSLFIRRQRRGLLRFSIFVTMLSFWAVTYGTFLTRSGVLADFSVHSFVDLGINQFLIGSVIFFVVLGLSLLVYRWRDIRPEASYSTVVSRSYIVTLGVVVLFVGGVLVLLGTSSPLLTRFTDHPSAVGLPYYFSTMTPVAIAVMVLLTLFPAFRWNKGLSRPGMLMLSGGAFLITIAALLIAGVTYKIIYLLFFGSAISCLLTNALVIVQSWRKGDVQWGYLAHVGLALAMIGAAVSAGFERKQTIRLPEGEKVAAMGYNLTFASLENTPKGFDCHVKIDDGSHPFMAVLHHEFPRNAKGVMRKPHVEKYLAYDVYVAPVNFEQPEDDGPGQLTIQKGKSKELDKYNFTFQDFEIMGHQENEPTSVVAVLKVNHDGQTEMVRPKLTVTGKDVSETPASFDSDRGSVMISGVDPSNESVLLQVSGDFIGAPQSVQAATLTIELSQKPLINLFWFGAMIVFLSGILSMRERRRRRSEAAAEDVLPEAEPVEETTVVAPVTSRALN